MARTSYPNYLAHPESWCIGRKATCEHAERVCISSQEPSVMTEDDNGSDNSQFTGSTINLQDLEWATRCGLPPTDLAAHSLHTHTLTRTTFPGLFGRQWAHRWNAPFEDMKWQWCWCNDKRYFWGLFLFFFFCTKMKRESNPMSQTLQSSLSLWVQWVLTVPVSNSMVPHRHLHTSPCRLCSSCLTDSSRCAFLHRRVLCFIGCHYEVISVSARFIFILQQWDEDEIMPVDVFVLMT